MVPIIVAMLAKSNCPSIESSRPRSFAGLMEIFELNYMRFRRLCPAQYGVGDGAVSRVSSGLDLHLTVLERSSYTTTVHLTYYLRESAEAVRPNPDFKLRIYYDALQAEVLSCVFDCLRNKTCVLGVNGRTELEDKWSVNCFLYKWLDYCLSQGHIFPSTAMHPRQQWRRPYPVVG
jgi:uncharacterized protein YqiB (DUF1249 family)